MSDYKIHTPALDAIIEQLDNALVIAYVFPNVDPFWLDLNEALKEIRSHISVVKHLEPKESKGE